MRPDLERLHLIEQQLLRGPAALPAAEWHLRQLLDGDLAADAADQVDRRDAGAPEHRLEVLTQRPQGEHVEKDVEVGRR